MPSPALAHWRSTSRTEIGHLLDTYLGVRLLDPDNTSAAEQLLHALVVQLAGRFQRFCRDLHDAAIDALVAPTPGAYRSLLRDVMLIGRRLDRHNATSAALRDDFGRFDLELWSDLAGAPAEARQVLDEVMSARNAIAHQDVGKLAHLGLDLAVLRRWRLTLDELAGSIDAAVMVKVDEIVGSFVESTTTGVLPS